MHLCNLIGGFTPNNNYYLGAKPPGKWILSQGFQPWRRGLSGGFAPTMGQDTQLQAFTSRSPKRRLLNAYKPSQGAKPLGVGAIARIAEMKCISAKQGALPLAQGIMKLLAAFY